MHRQPELCFCDRALQPHCCNKHSAQKLSIGVPAVCLLAAGLVSSVPAKRIQQFAVFAAIALVFGGVIIMILLPLCAPKLQTASWVFSSFFAWEKEEQGIPSDA